MAEKRTCRFCKVTLRVKGPDSVCCCSVRPCKHTVHLTPVYEWGYTAFTPPLFVRIMEDEGFEVGYRVAWRTAVQLVYEDDGVDGG